MGEAQPLSELVALALARLEDGGEAALAAFLAEHAGVREAIASRIASLQDLGLAPGAAAADAEAHAPATADPPRRFGPYEVIDRLGEGGFGEVFLARQEQPIQRQVALKLLRPAADAVNLLQRFAAERELLSRFDHPYIAKVLDAGVAPDGRPFLVVEHVAGESLTAFCARHQLDLDARLRLFARICDGVQHAHQRGVIHRDLKPSNVLVAHVDGEPWPKIIDFGIARVFDASRDAHAHTRAGTLLGTPEYMSPEQATGVADIDTRADVYALGVMLYELIVDDLPLGRARWRQASISEQVRLIRDVDVPRPSLRAGSGTLARRVRGDLDWIVLKAVAKDRSRRYRSVAELGDDVARHLRHEPVLAGPPSLSYAARKFVRRHRLAIAAAAVALTALLAGLVLSTAAWRRAAQAEAAANDRLAQFLGLSDVVLLRELVAAVDDLGPATPAHLAEHVAWLERAQALVDGGKRRAVLRAALEMRAAAAEAAPAERFLSETLDRLEADLVAFGAEDGPVAGVRRRVEQARVVERLSLQEPARAWAEAIAAIAVSPRYGGLRLEPQLGLVPLGPDPDTGLHEFGHLQSGAAPVRAADGRLAFDASSGIVLVLLPGGTATIGAQSRDASAPNYEPELTPGQGTVQDVELAPFFLGKYEVTRAQWQRVTGADASYRPVNDHTPGGAFTVRHPVDNLSYAMARRFARSLDLELPTEAQWEYACRAGTTTRWFTGDDELSLQGFANLAGRESAFLEAQGLTVARAFTDAWQVSSPCGATRPNAFGLHDLCGNAAEWCRDAPLNFSVPVRAGDGLREDASANEGNRVLRGASYRDPPVRAKSALRGAAPVDMRNIFAGVRPARDVR